MTRALPVFALLWPALPFTGRELGGRPGAPETDDILKMRNSKERHS